MDALPQSSLASEAAGAARPLFRAGPRGGGGGGGGGGGRSDVTGHTGGGVFEKSI